VIANFLKVDYAFESHPVFSPVHRVSVSVSPYLFSHTPAKEEGLLSPSEAYKTLLAEEPEDAEKVTDEGETPSSEEQPTEQGETAPAQESVPAGGIFWEE